MTEQMTKIKLKVVERGGVNEGFSVLWPLLNNHFGT